MQISASVSCSHPTYSAQRKELLYKSICSKIRTMPRNPLLNRCLNNSTFLIHLYKSGSFLIGKMRPRIPTRVREATKPPSPPSTKSQSTNSDQDTHAIPVQALTLARSASTIISRICVHRRISTARWTGSTPHSVAAASARFWIAVPACA